MIRVCRLWFQILKSASCSVCHVPGWMGTEPEGVVAAGGCGVLLALSVLTVSGQGVRIHFHRATDQVGAGGHARQLCNIVQCLGWLLYAHHDEGHFKHSIRLHASTIPRCRNKRFYIPRVLNGYCGHTGMPVLPFTLNGPCQGDL